MRTLRFAWQTLWREWRAGELKVLAVALAVAVASVSAVGFFTDRVRQSMDHRASELLAADLVLESNAPIAAKWRDEAASLGLASARTVSFRSVVLAHGQVQLAEVKAVGPGYPLRGELRIAEHPYGPARATHTLPATGSAWAGARLFQALHLAPSGRVHLGTLSLTVDRVVAYEPDRGGRLFHIAPRLMINLADLDRSGLLQTGSLATYRLLLAGPPTALSRFAATVRPQLGVGQRLVGVRQSRPELTSAFERAERFLGMSALVSVLLAGVAVATAARRYSQRHIDAVAILRCLGAPQGFIVGSHLLKLVGLGLIGALAGVGLGYGAQALLGWLVGDLFAADLPLPSYLPVVQGLATGLVMLLGFALPPVLGLRNVTPLRVLRRDLVPAPAGALGVYGAALTALFALTLWQVGEVKLTAMVFGGALLTLVLMWAVAWLLLAGLNRLRGGTVSWRFGLANLARRRTASIAQVLAFGLGIMVLLLLSLVRTDLLAQWQKSLPPGAPNHFLININPEQVAPLKQFLAHRGYPTVEAEPMVRARLAAINGRDVSAADYQSTRARRLVQHTFNLSWSARLPLANHLVAGHWWSRAGVPQWSVEAGLADTLGIQVGDRLRFVIGGEPVTGTVANLRSVDWDSFRVNFFVLAPPGTLQGYAATYITSFHVPASDPETLPALVARFPNVTDIDVNAVLQQVRAIIDRVVVAVEFVFLFTLAAGLVVLYAAIQASHDERLKEAAILRTLGARNRQLRAALLAEFIALGALAGLLAAAAAVATGYVLAGQLFGFSYQPGILPWAIGVFGGGAGIGLAGLAGTRRVMRQPPLLTLRGL